MPRSARKGKQIPHATAPVEAILGEPGVLLLQMSGLSDRPASGRLLQGLTPYLDGEGAQHVVLYAERQRTEPWSASPKPAPYRELIHWARSGGDGVYRGATWKESGITREEIVAAFQTESTYVVDWAARRAGAAVVCNKEPLLLDPCIVDKPWGREVWYTGIEQRGRSFVRSETGRTELPYALGMFPVSLIGEQERPPVLIKALEPLPEEVLGDLYLEVHREKWEVYVVLDVSRDAWPDGVGRLRAGLAPAAIERYRGLRGAGWPDALAQDLLADIRAYETVRRRIDARFDQALQARRLDPALGVPAALHGELSAELPEELRAEERRLRAAVEDYLGTTPMPEGAVACLPPGMLHSLQHGVKVIEFQTPTYERLIAMFAQKVLTQRHWNSEAAVKLMHKAAYSPPQPEQLEREPGWTLERIVAFPEFEVQRLALGPGAVRPSATTGGAQYQLLLGVLGAGTVDVPGRGPTPIGKETVLLLPATLGAFKVRADGEGLTCLVMLPAEPRDGKPLARLEL